MKVVGSTLVVILLATGLALLGYARWSGAIGAADRDLANGDLQAAIANYQIAEGRFEALPAVKQVVPGEHARAISNHLWALYRLQRYDEVIDLAQKAPPESTPHFWSACAFFQKASVEEKLETLDDIYRFAVEQVSIARGQLLELTIVGILVFELILFFMGIMT